MPGTPLGTAGLVPAGKTLMHAEVVIRPDSTAALAEVQDAAHVWLTSLSKIPNAASRLSPPATDHPFLAAHVQEILLSGADGEEEGCANASRDFYLPWEVVFQVHAYVLDCHGPEEDDEGDEDAPSYRQWALPCTHFQGLWDALHFDTAVKRRLLRYADSALLFASAGVDPNLVNFGRTVLLHGPPGTGKTSLCKALAQRLAVRLSAHYPTAQLIEVNAHSLMSKWFSESGKLVARLFGRIQEALQEQDVLVLVLVDEVESLATARTAGAGGSEPGDAVRAVNALLTQLDQLRGYKNCMVLTTSNITGAIDLAFVDRADIKAYIGPPTLRARYEIMRSSLEALQWAGIIADAPPLLAYWAAEQAAAAAQQDAACTGATLMQMEQGGQAAAAASTLSCQLLAAAAAAEGFSGRALRKLPFLAHAGSDFAGGRCTTAEFLTALGAAVEREREDRSALDQA